VRKEKVRGKNLITKPQIEDRSPNPKISKPRGIPRMQEHGEKFFLKDGGCLTNGRTLGESALKPDRGPNAKKELRGG